MGEPIDIRFECETCREHAHEEAEHRRITQFLTAAASGAVDIVLREIRAGFRPDLRPRGEQTALARAILGEHIACAWVLLGAGANPNIASRHETPMHAAATIGESTLMKSMIAVGGDVNWPGIDAGTTPIEVAVIHGHVPVINLLREHGDNAEWSDLLLLSLNHKRHEVTEWLIKHRWADHVPGSVMRIALRDAPRDIVLRILDARIHDDGEVVHTAVERGDIQIIQRILAQGLDVNRLNRHAMTPVEVTPNGLTLDLEIVNLLINAGAKKRPS